MNRCWHSACPTFAAAILIFGIFSCQFTEGINRPNHFSDPCKLCECFAFYTDRDLSVSVSPYRIVKDPYESTEDRCLALCLNDPNCKMAVYGFVGGRSVFTCELYDKLNVQNAIYVPFTNLYVKRPVECAKSPYGFVELQTTSVDDSVKENIAMRKSRYLRLWQKQNFFNFG